MSSSVNLNNTGNSTESGYQFISLLPAVNQTDALTRFFGSTVDQVFQPGTFVPINAYVGLYPSYYNSVTDFYYIDSNDPRSNYQLCPGMISLGNTANVAYSLVYPDLISYLDAQGAVTSQQSRMFETDYYSWGPPLDIDKLTNYIQYYWFGNYAGATELPTLTLTSPISTYIGDGFTDTFELPASVANITASQETIAAYVNGVKVSDIVVLDNAVTLPLTPNNLDTVAVTRHDDLSVAITGQTSFALSAFISNTINAPALTSGMRIYLQDASRIFGGFSTNIVLGTSNTPLIVDFDQTYLANGTIHDHAGFDPVQYTTFMVDGVGRSIRLTPDSLINRELPPQYVTIDRSSVDQNQWSLTNCWVHKDSFAWSGKTFSNLQAKRPIIEFTRDILLYNYGTTRIDEIDGVLSTNNALLNGTTPIAASAIAGQMNGLTVDNGTNVFPGMRLLIAQTASTIQQLYLVGVSNGLITLTPQTQNEGDIAKIRHASGYGAAGIEMYFNGITWKVAQVWGENVDPLFRMFDINGVSLDDPNTYPNSDFAGNRIFGFAAGNGPDDPVLLRPLQYDDNGYIIFENDSVSNPASEINNGLSNTISCLYCYETQENAGVPQSLWHRTANATSQDILTVDFEGNVYWNLPLNLTANPQTDDVTYVSQGYWLNHFEEIIENQVGFTGNAFANNNYRDTPQDLSLGFEILQHVAPILKVMLLATEPKFDYFASVRFVDLNYSLFRNQFVRKLVVLDNAGTVPSNTSNEQWVSIVLNSLKLNRNASFPFFLSTMGGGQYFIPATPTFLGLLPAYEPAIISDNTYSTPVNMIRGHDGSLTPAFNDWRDPIILALEQQIYNSIPSNYVNLERPLFDIEYYLAGRFCPSSTGYFSNGANPNPYVTVSYKRGEVQTMLASMFELWAQTSGLDYRTNTTYDSIQPFTWNYHGVADKFGSLLPGHWKAIYRWYFDTERPHTNPWEMLGFANMPSWWTATYGTNYGSGNTALWSDLEGGIIRQGPRAGYNLRYARPGLSTVLPVDPHGNLLDPVAAGIVPIPPTVAMASANWQIGDGGPVENIWITSPSYRYALAQVAFMAKPARLVEMVWDSVNYGFSSFGDQWIDFRTLQRPEDANTLVHGETNANGGLVTIYGIQQWISDYLVSAGLSSSLLGTAIRGLDVRLIQRMAAFISSDDLSVVADNFGVLPSEDTQVVLYQSPVTDTEVYSGVIVEWAGNGWKVIGYDARNPNFTVIPPDVNGPKGIISLSDTPEPVIVPWSPNTYYRANQIVTYTGITYQTAIAHTSAASFTSPAESSYWTVVAGTYPQAPRVIYYLNGLINTTNTVPYGTLFTTIQQVSDFLLGYERWLLTRGWVFDVTTSSGVNNWNAAVKQFLSWQQINWAVGNFIALSPGATELHFEAATGTVLNVEDSTTGFFGLLDRSGAPIPSSAVQLSRLNGDLMLIAESADIFCCRVRIVNIEHALIISNLTIFNDPVYLPLYNMQQARLKILGNITTNWVGRLNAPGFIIEGGSVVPSFNRNVEDIQVMYDIEQSLRKDFTDFARHNIGYQTRDYLQDLLLAEVEQFEFYQGMIKQKGTPSVFNALLRSSRVSANSNIQYLEEFAIRYPRFGGPIDPRITFLLAQSSVHTNPVFIRLGDYPQSDPAWVILNSNSTNWIDRPAPNKPFFPALPPPDPNNSKPNLIPTVGPVRLSDTDYQFFYPDYFQGYYQSALANGANSLDQGDGTTGIFATGQTVWVYQDDTAFQWNVYEVFELGYYQNYITYTITTNDDPSVQGLRIFFAYPIGLTTANEGDYIVVDGLAYTTPEIQGVQIIEVVNAVGNYIDIGIPATAGYDFLSNTNGERAEPNVRILQSVRFANIAALDASPLLFQDGDLAWVDHDEDNGGLWTVYQYTANATANTTANSTTFSTEWTLARIQPPRVDTRAIVTASVYDISTQITVSGSVRQIIANGPVLDDLTLVDPLADVFPGTARKEIDFLSPFDPARYSNTVFLSTSIDTWGDDQVGRVWWDLSTVRYLEPYTDQIGVTAQRDLAEIDHRTSTWATIAPYTSVDVYEWTKSELTPLQYMAAASNSTSGTYGSIYTGLNGNISDTPSFVQRSEYSAAFNTDITYYYYWIKGLATTPNVPFRNTPVADIASILQSPTSQDIPWFAPIMQDGMLASGLVPYLNDTSTVLKVETTNRANDQGHGQWFLMRQNDETSLPPDWLWRALTNSLAQFDEAVRPLPSPSLSPYRAVGILPNQNMFEIDQTPGDRLGLLGARESFVGIINYIWAQNPIVIQRPLTIGALSRSTPIDPLLVWTRPDDSYVIEPPPVNEWDYEVYSQNERNRLVLTPAFISAAANGTTLRVLINGTNNSTPQWSIYWFVGEVAQHYYELSFSQGQPAFETLYNNANSIFSLAPSYEISVSTHAERNALTDLAAGTRVYVEQDETAYDFWVVYSYEPANSNADANGFVVHRVQSYRTSDFYSIVDWYDQDFNNGLQTLSFSANNPPQISYTSTSAAYQAEGSNPTNVFIAITPPTGGWFWQYYANGVWTTVAQQSATIALSSQFYNPSAVIHAVNTVETSTIFNRDGSWELKVLADAARGNGTLLDTEINEVFFSIVHYVHAQQDDVDWIFKTSFMTIAGYSIPLLQTAIQQEDVSNSLISFVDEVKPYHVKVRDYTAQYVPPTDVGNVYATDFDKPVYFDNTINAYRVLNPNLSTDLSIIQNNEPWQDWYKNYASPMVQNSEGFWLNPVRHMKITIAFDRVADIDSGFDRTGFDVIGFDLNESAANTAVDRITDYYTPLAGMPPLDVPNLINTLFRYPSIPIDGNTLGNAAYDVDYRGVIDQSNGLAGVAVSINPTRLPPGYDPGYGRIDNATRTATDLFVDYQHPEERVATITDDAVSMVVSSNGVPGAPLQWVKVFSTLANAQTFFYDEIAQSAEGVFVYLDGIRANLGVDYTVDHFGQSITLLSNANQVSVRVFGFGGAAGIVEQHLVSYDGDIALDATYETNSVQVIVDGYVQDDSAYAVSNVVSFVDAPAANSDVAVIVWDSPVSNVCQPHMQMLDLANGISLGNTVSFDLNYPDLQTVPAFAGTIVEADGMRLLPPLTYYGTFDKNRRYLGVDFQISLDTIIDLMIDGVYYSNVAVPRWNGVSQDGYYTGYPFNLVPDLSNLPSEDVPGYFVIYDQYLVSVDPGFMAKEVAAIFYEESLMQYQVIDNTVVIAEGVVANTGSILVTTFSNAEVMGIKTQTYFASLDSQYPVCAPFSEAYSMVSFDGRMLVPQLDYDFAAVLENFGQTVFGAPFGDQVFSKSVLTIPLDPSAIGGMKPIVVTIFTGQPAQMPQVWRAATTTPAGVRMEQALTSGGFDTDYFDAPFSRFDAPFAWKFDYPRHQQHGNTNPVQVYQMDGKWEFTNQSILNTGSLVNDLGPHDNSCVVALNLGDTSPRLWPIQLAPMGNSSLTWVGSVFSMPDTANNQPGVVWIGGERIEYFGLSYDPPTYASYPAVLTPPNIILSGLRRGTRGTPSQNENRAVTVLACDGMTDTFTVNAVGHWTDVQVLRGSANTSNWMDYFLTLANTATAIAANSADHVWPTLNNMTISNSAGTVVTMDDAPPIGSFVVLSVTIDQSHPAGTVVADGTSIFQPLRFPQRQPDRLSYRPELVI